MPKTLVVAFAAVGLSACVAEAPSPAPAPPAPPPPCADPSADTILAFGSLTLHPLTAAPAAGLWVCGRMVDGRFAPRGDVVGDGPLGEAGAPGWVELCDPSFHGAQTGRPPFPPYVEGFRLPDGAFVPSTRRVVY